MTERWLALSGTHTQPRAVSGYGTAAASRMRRPLLTLLLLLLPTISTAVSEASVTVLELPPLPAVWAAPALPESVFHAWDDAEREAASIAAAWNEGDALTVPWTEVQLRRYVKHKQMPTRGARGLALVHVAMHDAWWLANEQALDPRLAVSMAAGDVLGYLFPAEERAFERIVFALAGQLSEQSRDALPERAGQAMALGRWVAQAVIAHGEADGAAYGWNGARLQWYGEGRDYGPGTWEPTPPYHYFPPDEPYAPGWRTWVMAGADQFRPTPPAYGSPQFLAALREVIEVNRTLDEEGERIARFWVDGHGSVTPPGHWNQIAIEHARQAGLDDATAVRVFVDLNLALADTFVAVWDAKYHYWTARPITAARRVLGVEFKPTILTPPFPSYPSGHAGFSGAAAEILAAYFPAHEAQLRAMAEEAANSRLLGGIHYRYDNEDGLALGRQIARLVLARHSLGLPLPPTAQSQQPNGSSLRTTTIDTPSLDPDSAGAPALETPDYAF